MQPQKCYRFFLSSLWSVFASTSRISRSYKLSILSYSNLQQQSLPLMFLWRLARASQFSVLCLLLLFLDVPGADAAFTLQFKGPRWLPKDGYTFKWNLTASEPFTNATL
eukprot:g5468.t1